MKSYTTIAGWAAAVALLAAPAFAQNGSSSAATSPSRASTSQVPAKENLALSWLQDARVTLARLTEASMSQDARNAVARVSTDFRAMYKAYTGEEPTEEKSATQAVMDDHHMPDPSWEKEYADMKSGIDRIVGLPAGSTPETAVGTSGSSSAASAPGSSHVELTVPVRKDLVLLRDQIGHFKTAAGK